MILFSVQDLFGYLRAHATMSGIQRVQAGIALHAIAEGDGFGFIVNDLTDNYVDGDFKLIPTAAFREVIDYASGPRVDHNVMRRMLDECEAESEVIRPRPGDAIILLGAFWGHGNTLDRYVAAKRDGVRIGAYVYDIIPITHPEFCDAELAHDFAMSLGELALLVDFIFTISDYTRHSLQRLFRQAGARDIPMRTVPLAHALTSSTDGRAAWPISLRGIQGRPYVAYISTVEGRKNHLYVVNAWRQLIEDGVDVPDLVFVGRRGWRVGGLNDVLDGTSNLDGRVHIVRDLTDAELDTVYSHCLFTVFTSFVEGWGLPVGESLVHGVPCVASSTSSIPEVGGELVDYVDPFNLREGIAAFRRMIEDRAYREARRSVIAREFSPRSWEDVGRDFLAKTREALSVDYAPHRTIPWLGDGTCFTIGDIVTARVDTLGYMRSPMRLALTESFFQPEPFGAWMRGHVGQLRFATDLAPGTDIVVYVRCSTPGSAAGKLMLTVRTTADKTAGRRPHRLLSGDRNLIRVNGKIGAEGICTLLFELEGEIPVWSNDSRTFGVGLGALGYAAADDMRMREELFERLLCHDMTPLSA